MNFFSLIDYVQVVLIIYVKKKKTIVSFLKIYVEQKNHYRNLAFLLEFSTSTTTDTKKKLCA